MPISKSTSLTISFLRFPMIAAVVFIHGIGYSLFSSKGITPPRVYSIFYEFVTAGICRIAVPLFYMISGFLFFAENWCKAAFLR